MQKKVSFKNTKGQRLVGILHIPSPRPFGPELTSVSSRYRDKAEGVKSRGKGQGPFPAVIVQHGLSADYNDPLVKLVALNLEKASFIALRFSFSGHQYSAGGYKDVLVSQFVKDTEQAVNYLLKYPQVNKFRIGIVGHSLGGFTALIAGSRLKKFIKSVISIASFYDIDKLIKNNIKKENIKIHPDYFVMRDLKVIKNHFKDRVYLQRKSSLSDIHCPTLIIHGNQDEVVEVKDSQTIFKLLNEPKNIEIIKGADHNFTSKKHRQKVVNSAVSWFKQYLAFKESKVVNVLILYRDKILLLKRSKKVGTYPGCWSGVGGFMEKGESALVTAQKEVEEELKIKKSQLKNYFLGQSFKLNDKAIDRIWRVHPVLFKLARQPKIQLDWENSEYRWVKLSDVQRYKIVPGMARSLLMFRHN